METSEQHWSSRKQWQNGRIRPQYARLGFVITLIFFVVWTGIALWVYWINRVVIERAINRFIESGYQQFDEMLFIPLMFLLSLVMLPSLVKTFRRFRMASKLTLNLDPYPGQVGGEVGGDLIVPIQYCSGMQAEVKINCIDVSITRSSNRSSRWEKVRYRTRADVQLMPVADGTMIRFSAITSPDLPESSVEEKGGHVYWAVRIELPEDNVAETFNIPVFADQSGTSIDYYAAAYDSEAETVSDDIASIPETVAQITHRGNDLRIEYPAGRGGAMAKLLIFMGVIFSMVALWMGYEVYTELASSRTSYFAVMVSGMIFLGFALFGVGMLFGGIYVLSNRLKVDITRDQIATSRSVFGREFNKNIPIDQVVALDKRVTSQTGQGASAKVNYTLYAKTRDGMKYSLGDGVPGHENADRLFKFLQQHIGLPELSGEADLPEKLPLPPWVKNVARYAKLVSILIMLLTFGAFVLDFMR